MTSQEENRIESPFIQEYKGLLAARKFHDAHKLVMEIPLHSTNANLFAMLGILASNSGGYELASFLFSKAVDNKPSEILTEYYAKCLTNWGTILKQQGNFSEAIAKYQQAIAIKPSFAVAHAYLGCILYCYLAEYDQSTQSFQQAIQLGVNEVDLYQLCANELYNLQKFPEAIKYYEKALSKYPNHAGFHFNISQVLLKLGNLEKGFMHYEWRLQKEDYQWCQDKPQWHGEFFLGKRLLVHDEQGLGDSIHFIRYLPMVKARGGTVIVSTKKGLLRLFHGFPGIDEIVEHNPAMISSSSFDLYIPLLSLPRIFGTTLANIPSPASYLTYIPNLYHDWQHRMHPTNYKVGLVWRGDPNNPDDRNRSCHLSDFFCLGKKSDVSFYSLQKGSAPSEGKNPPAELNLIDWTDELHDWADTAALIANLDLIISVDTAVAHLAGALGKPVWILVCYNPDWRWMLGREDNPWYPSARLFRQTRPGNWESVMEKILQELSCIVT